MIGRHASVGFYPGDERNLAVRGLVAILGGCMAEALRGGAALELCQGDVLKAHNAAAMAAGHEDTPVLVRAAARATKRLLRDRWHTVEAVAEELLRTHLLEGGALRELLPEAAEKGFHR